MATEKVRQTCGEREGSDQPKVGQYDRYAASGRDRSLVALRALPVTSGPALPGADVQLSDEVVRNVGVGFGATGAGNTLVYKTRLGWLFSGEWRVIRS